MSKAIRVPDPVYDRLEDEKERQDKSMGAIVADWMHSHDRMQEFDVVEVDNGP